MFQKVTVIYCRCTVRECFGTLMWPLSWFWLPKMTDYQSSKCGTFVSPHRPLKFLKTTPGEGSLTPFDVLVFEIWWCGFCWSFPSGEFCQYPGVRPTLSFCWVVRKTTGSFVGIQTLERYIITFVPIYYPWDSFCHEQAFCEIHGFPMLIFMDLGHLWARHCEPVVFWRPVVPQESCLAFNCLIWWQNNRLLCNGRESKGSTAKHSR